MYTSSGLMPLIRRWVSWDSERIISLINLLIGQERMFKYFTLHSYMVPSSLSESKRLYNNFLPGSNLHGGEKVEILYVGHLTGWLVASLLVSCLSWKLICISTLAKWLWLENVGKKNYCSGFSHLQNRLKTSVHWYKGGVSLVYLCLGMVSGHMGCWLLIDY